MLGMQLLGHGKARNQHLGDPLDMVRVRLILAAYERDQPIWNHPLLEKKPHPPRMTAKEIALLEQVPLNPELRLTDRLKGQAVAVK